MRHVRMLVILSLVAALLAMSSPAGAATGTFVDDDGIPGERHIERLAELGAIQGCDPPQNTRSCR